MTHRITAGAALALATTLMALSSTADESGPFHALRLDPGNFDRYSVGGPHAIAGIGDWALGNGVLCAAVSDIGRPGRFSMHGGALVDLGHCGRRDDQFVVIHPMLNLSREHSAPFDEIAALPGEGAARIRVRGASEGLLYERTFELDLDEPRRLRVLTTVKRGGPGARLHAWGDLTMHPNASLRPFSAVLGAPERSAGFVHPSSEGESVRSRMAGISEGDLHVMVGEDSLEPQIAYGLHFAEKKLVDAEGEHPLPGFAIVSEHFGMTNVATRPPLFAGSEGVGLFQIAQGFLFSNVRLDETLHLRSDIWVSERADVASITDHLFRDARLVAGRVDDAGARIHVDTAAGDPLTEVRPRSSGRFSFRAPPGAYRLRIAAPGGRTLEREFRVSAEGPATSPNSSVPALDLGLMLVGAPARFVLPRAGPMRIVFVGLGDTPNPKLRDDLLGLRIGALEPESAQASNSVSLAGVASDPSAVTLPPGRYRAIATRGPEFELETAEIEARAGEVRPLVLDAPKRAIETPGWIAADLHVHSAASFDSGLDYVERVRSFRAQGGELLVATEHDRVMDIAPAIRELGLDGLIASVVGVESTSVLRSEAAPYTFGHANVFPMPLRPKLFRGGAPTSQGVRLRQMMAEVRALGGERVVQLNHPRSRDGLRNDGAFFTHLSLPDTPFRPDRPLDSEANAVALERDPVSGIRDLDFDAIELLNGDSTNSSNFYKMVRADWFSMLLQGERRTATANSDSHRLHTPVGVPRTYVPQADDRPSEFRATPFVSALRQGRAFGTTGPFLEVELRSEGSEPSEPSRGSAGMGDLFSGGSATLHIRTRAPSWAAATRARVFVNARPQGEFALDAQGDARVELGFDGDAFVTVEVTGPQSDDFSALLANAVPFAFSNPIFVDADADGAWTPPGLPKDLPITLTEPLASP